ncbi:rubredoxin [Chloroflexota bacterium]
MYDTEVSNPDGVIAAGTQFEKIPDDWQCPTCGAAKSDFEKIYSGSALPR